MSIRRHNADRAFTLLEVMISTMIVAMLTFSLYRFISANLTALKYSTDLHDERQSMRSVGSFLQEQMNELSPRRQGVLTGAPFKFKDLSSDEMTWLCSGGHGVLTGAAPDNYRVTLALQPVEKGGGKLELGLRREIVGSESDVRLNADFFTRGTGQQKYSWLPLMRGVSAIRIRYFDPRLNSVIDRWTDLAARPTVVWVTIWRNPEDEPFEIALDVPAARIR